MNIQETINFHRDQLVKSLSQIADLPTGLLPHIVYIEEENDSVYPVYNRYNLLSINADGSCVVQYPTTKQEEVRHLSEINIDWLTTVWNYYSDLRIIENQKKPFAFIYHYEKIERNTSDEEIIADCKKQDSKPYTEKLTLEAFEHRVNNEQFNDLEYWVRFITC